jgi:hypothetical protein
VSADHILPQQRTACLRSLSLLVVNEISNEDRVCNIVLSGQECGTPYGQIWVSHDNNLMTFRRANFSTSGKTGPNTNLLTRISLQCLFQQLHNNKKIDYKYT